MDKAENKWKQGFSEGEGLGNHFRDEHKLRIDRKRTKDSLEL